MTGGGGIAFGIKRNQPVALVILFFEPAAFRIQEKALFEILNIWF